jgi:hypothetical protein
MVFDMCKREVELNARLLLLLKTKKRYDERLKWLVETSLLDTLSVACCCRKEFDVVGRNLMLSRLGVTKATLMED